jgi:predicted MPP superfamily phosphohydrolase
MGTNLFFLSSLSSKLFETRESWISWEKLFVFDLNDLHMAPFWSRRRSAVEARLFESRTLALALCSLVVDWLVGGARAAKGCRYLLYSWVM